jgi:hypothetical protein
MNPQQEIETISKGQEKNGKITERRFSVYEAEFPNLESSGMQRFLSIERNFSFGHFGDFSS